MVAAPSSYCTLTGEDSSPAREGMQPPHFSSHGVDGHLDVSENSGFSPQIIHGLIGFSMIFTIHFGGNTPIFGNTHLEGEQPQPDP